MSLSLAPTLVILAVAVALWALAYLEGRRPVEVRRARWVPYTGMQFLAAVAFIVMLAHLVSLLTGQPLEGRLSR